jgi:chitinase
MPCPYSKTYAKGSYYENKPEQYAKDYYNLVKGTGLEYYFDLDIECIDVNDDFLICSDFIGNVCKQLKILSPKCEISHAPQTPYFTSQYGNIYNLIYQNYKKYFDWFNIQFYNNGPSQTYEQIFIESDDTSAPKTSVLELIKAGIDASYIVIGKTIQGESPPDGGYVDLNIMKNYVCKAYSDPVFVNWKNNGGVMIWFYDSQFKNIPNNKMVLDYFSYIPSCKP